MDQPIENHSVLISLIQKYIYDYLMSGPSPVSEHKLLTAMSSAGVFDSLATDDISLALFQKHFLTMHALYSLRDRFFNKGFTLIIDPLAIQLLKVNSAHLDQDSRKSLQPGKSDKQLSDYYLDLGNYQTASVESVEKLYVDFAQMYTAWLNADEAYSVLQIDDRASWKEVQASYRRLASQNHPDKGGDAEVFKKIKIAYEQVKMRHSTHHH